MMRREYFPVLWFILVSSVIGPAFMDVVAAAFGLPENYYDAIPAIPFAMVTLGCVTFIVCLFVIVMKLCGDDLSSETHEFLFGRGSYNFLWTFPMIPCAIFGYAKEVYVYAIPVTLIFLVLEYLRTNQNDYAKMYRNAEIAERLRKAAQGNPKEVHLE